jgi:aryl-alcohol dehydrogenase-like predicted oxidoreductase
MTPMTSHEQRYRLGPVTVSRIGFGAMQLPGPGVFGPPRDRGQAVADIELDSAAREALASAG